MPVMQVYHPETGLTPPQKQALATKLTDILLRMEGGAKTQGGLAFATVLFTSVREGDWWVGGRTDGSHLQPPGKFLVRVTIPEGYMNQAHKSEVHAWVNTAFLEVFDLTTEFPAAGANILVTIEEITEGNWGCRGQTISLASIAESVGLSKTGARFQWVRNYFAAKARQFAVAGYPPDTGGLLAEDRTQ
jgi:phenylpyruvate tautomerase PptA (4-oxalocrotonate tautomerase family)